MKKLHTFSWFERPLALLLKERLENEEISCIVRNDQLSAVIGEIPFLECFPELWVIDDEMWPRARRLLDLWLKAEDPAEEWSCKACGEQSDGQFDRCWSCGIERPDKPIVRKE